MIKNKRIFYKNIYIICIKRRIQLDVAIGLVIKWYTSITYSACQLHLKLGF